MQLDQESFARFVLLRLEDWTNKHYWSVLAEFESALAFLTEPSASARGRVSAEGSKRLADYRRLGEASELGQQVLRELEVFTQLNVKLLFHHQDQYPNLLKEIADPPPILYLLGSALSLALPQLAIVGSRNATPQGLDNARLFAKELSASGFAISSGLALGVDGAAHRGALEGGGATVAVLGTGIDEIYPRRHQSLAEEIVASGGAVVSEFPLGCRPLARNFPRRNRIITGLTLGTLVVEAAMRSGSLVSARLALEQDREVYAIPGSIHSPLSRGCHSLIKQGAHLVESAADIVEQLGGPLARQVELAFEQHEEPALEQDAEDVMAALAYDACSLDQLQQRCALDVGQLSARLMELEIAGLISQWDGLYQRRQEQDKST